jgi:hypothetical protein
MAIPFLHNINLDDNQLQNAKLHVTSSAPTAAKGQIYLDSTSNVDKLKYYDGTGWVVADATVSASYNTSDGVITFTTSSGDTYTVDIDGKYIESVVGGTYITESVTGQTVTLNHDNTSRSDTTSTDAPAYGGTFEAVTSVTTNATGHVTAIDVSTVTIPAAEDYTWSLTADSGSVQVINDGNTVDVAGGTYITTVVGATDTVTINHDSTSRSDTTSTDAPDFGATFEAVTSVTTNGTGHVTAIDVSTVTIPQNDSLDVTSATTGTFYPTFVSATGDVAFNIDGNASDKLSYNAATQTLTVKNLVVPGTQTIQNETIQVVQDNIIRFEGATADGFETDLTVVDPTADRTITLPDETGTVVLNAFKTVTSDSGSAVADSDTDTLTISGGNAIETSANSSTDTITINHADTSSQASVNNSGNTVIQDVFVDTYGHITGINSTTITVPSDNELAVDLDATESAVTKATNTYTVTHTLSSRDLIVQVYDTSTYDTVFVDVSRPTTTTVTVAFASSVTDGDYRVLIKKIG